MKTISVALGEKEYEIRQLPFKQSRQWRQDFAAPIETLVGSLQFTGDLLGGGINRSTELGSVVKDLGNLVLGDIGRTLIGSIDILADMLFAYSPELDAHRVEIEACAYDDEILRAFAEVLKLAYPFSEILSAIRGQASQATRKS